ncbi:MAG: hypothetical protein JW908_15650 [Anaerolineales bacterium]|nr:hypothetical protein [Anaerolineales bacterium]
MRIIKQVLLVIVATAGVAYLLTWSTDHFGFRSPVFAFLANLLIIAWIVILGQTMVFTFPPRYFSVKRFERNGRLYEMLGIKIFKKLVGRGPLSIFSPTLRFTGRKSALSSLENEMRKAEAGHLTIFLVILLFAGMAMVRGWFDAAGWLLLFSIILNGYPIMLQRYNRIQIYRIVNKRKPTKKSKK